VVKYLGFNTPFADSKGLCGANPKYLTYAEHGGSFFEISPASPESRRAGRWRAGLSETLITLLTINASTFERYQEMRGGNDVIQKEYS
jgi:hypothetical protein